MNDELFAANALDKEITETLQGHPPTGTDPRVLWLAASIRTNPPAALERRVARIAAQQARHRWRSFQIVAASLAALFILHGLSGFFAGEWIASNLREPFSRHAAFEAGLAFVAAGAAVGAGAIRRRWAPVSVAAGTPLGVLLATHGVRELAVFPYGAALHLTEGALAIALFVIWIRNHRYTKAGRHEEKS
ncbi:hypothetical protein [Hoyosella subflava]|uniref:Uncharacterized protein n=1 Tax=Hoyosella subflava (strain DSM 45089 / JCM 17490 / NBRC 109087 / DQS3-9A1) TaxID=443218 RepID=F6EFP3_HOYSD|nr:hypothetical protein [Hoyosella subflava]AEF40972.1 hypothetical protein AS9A_2525 [Hoyosella subflava DQS3-9A1]